MEILFTLLGFFVFFLGAFMAWFLSGRKKEFRWSGYFMFLLGILGTLIIYHSIFGAHYTPIFIAGMLFGWFFEVSWGFIFHVSFGQKLWHYRMYPIFGGHVASITPPFWGFATILFFRILEITNFLQKFLAPLILS